MAKFKNFYDAWWFLVDHPEFNDTENHQYTFNTCLNIDVQKVNPKTKRIDDDDSLNTKTEVWLECGGEIFDENLQRKVSCHDIRLDCGGDTFEEAIIKLANLVKKYYGEYNVEES